MVKKLKRKFIMISTLSVTLVMLILSVIVNAANYASVSGGLDELLVAIADNGGSLPLYQFGKSGINVFGPETQYSTRYFSLKFTGTGRLVRVRLDNIAAVTLADIDTYLAVASKHGDGFGYYSDYKYYVKTSEDGAFTAVFLDCAKEIRSVSSLIVFSAAALVGCVALVAVIATLLSKKAIDPIAKSIERQKQFITDASHELKTPITVINTSLSVLEMEVGRQKWIDKARFQTDKLTSLVGSLVTLSRMEEENEARFRTFDISSAVSETVDSFADFALAAGHGINSTIEPSVSFKGDEYAVRQLVSVLIDNAVKYAAEGSDIEFDFSKTKKGVMIRSSNRFVREGEESGGKASAKGDPGSAGGDMRGEKDLSRLFDRFYRGDKARSGTGGFGIGLSIARTVAEAHNGTIGASLDGDTIIFTVELRNS